MGYHLLLLSILQRGWVSVGGRVHVWFLFVTNSMKCHLFLSGQYTRHCGQSATLRTPSQQPKRYSCTWFRLSPSEESIQELQEDDSQLVDEPNTSSYSLCCSVKRSSPPYLTIVHHFCRLCASPFYLRSLMISPSENFVSYIEHFC
jgi:hypothetical protein